MLGRHCQWQANAAVRSVCLSKHKPESRLRSAHGRVNGLLGPVEGRSGSPRHVSVHQRRSISCMRGAHGRHRGLQRIKPSWRVHPTVGRVRLRLRRRGSLVRASDRRSDHLLGLRRRPHHAAPGNIHRPQGCRLARLRHPPRWGRRLLGTRVWQRAARAALASRRVLCNQRRGLSRLRASGRRRNRVLGGRLLWTVHAPGRRLCLGQCG